MKLMKLKTMKPAAWFTPTMAKTTPATMLTEPSATIPLRLAGAREKSRWRNPGANAAPWKS